MRRRFAETMPAQRPQSWPRIVLTVVEFVEQGAFWLAVLLPISYPFMLPTMVSSVNVAAFLGVIVLHTSALVIGQHHEPGH